MVKTGNPLAIMTQFGTCAHAALTRVGAVLFDIDDTLTWQGRLPARAYAALERLQNAGRKTVAVTGRPAGWCDLIARFWPVDGVVGENGAFYFRYDNDGRRMIRRYVRSPEARARDHETLMSWFAGLQGDHPAIRLAADQAFRISDIAIDVCEDVPPLDGAEVRALMETLRRLGASVKLSSIHINAWIGDFDKLTMARRFLIEELHMAEGDLAERVLYIGDSPNDEPMFRAFPLSVGVRNIEPYLDGLTHRPAYLTEAPGGEGFAEMAEILLGHAS